MMEFVIGALTIANVLVLTKIGLTTQDILKEEGLL